MSRLLTWNEFRSEFKSRDLYNRDSDESYISQVSNAYNTYKNEFIPETSYDYSSRLDWNEFRERFYSEGMYDRSSGVHHTRQLGDAWREYYNNFQPVVITREPVEQAPVAEQAIDEQKIINEVSSEAMKKIEQEAITEAVQQSEEETGVVMLETMEKIEKAVSNVPIDEAMEKIEEAIQDNTAEEQKIIIEIATEVIRKIKEEAIVKASSDEQKIIEEVSSEVIRKIEEEAIVKASSDEQKIIEEVSSEVIRKIEEEATVKASSDEQKIIEEVSSEVIRKIEEEAIHDAEETKNIQRYIKKSYMFHKNTKDFGNFGIVLKSSIKPHIFDEEIKRIYFARDEGVEHGDGLKNALIQIGAPEEPDYKQFEGKSAEDYQTAVFWYVDSVCSLLANNTIIFTEYLRDVKHIDIEVQNTMLIYEFIDKQAVKHNYSNGDAFLLNIGNNVVELGVYHNELLKSINAFRDGKLPDNGAYVMFNKRKDAIHIEAQNINELFIKTNFIFRLLTDITNMLSFYYYIQLLKDNQRNIQQKLITAKRKIAVLNNTREDYPIVGFEAYRHDDLEIVKNYHSLLHLIGTYLEAGYGGRNSYEQYEYISYGSLIRFANIVINEYGMMSKTILTEQQLAELRAFNPGNDVKFHQTSSASTKQNRLCIYESYLHITGKRTLKYRRDDTKNRHDIKNRLSQEGNEIEAAVINGEVITALKLLTAKYNETIPMKFYVRYNEERVAPLLFENGEVKNDIDLKLYEGKEILMLDRKYQHMAPTIYKTPTDKEIKNEDKDRYSSFKLKPNKKVKRFSDAGFLVYDIETYSGENDKAIPFTICLYGYVKMKAEMECYKQIFYGENCVFEFVWYIFTNFFRPMNRSKTRPKRAVKTVNIWGFNNSRFDNILIFKEIHKQGFRGSFIINNHTIKSMKYDNIKFYDLAMIYSGTSLRKLAESFKIPLSKGDFPHKFASKINLDYIGQIPEEKYWSKPEDLKNFMNENKDMKEFDFKKVASDYCMRDCVVTYQCIEKHLQFCKGVINEQKYDVSDKLTAASISLSIFQQAFLDIEIYQSSEKVLEIEKLAYKGGRVSVFKNLLPEGKTLNYYDINSSYPASMLNPMPINPVNIKLEMKEHELKIDDVFADSLYKIRCEFKQTSEPVIINLLARGKNGLYVMIEEKEATWHWGAEIFEYLKDGHRAFCSGLIDYESKVIFKEYVEYFYKMKAEAGEKKDAVGKAFAKLLLNSLYGKFAQKDFTNTIICDGLAEALEIIGSNKLLNIIDMDDVELGIIVEYENKSSPLQNIGKLAKLSSYIAALSRCNLHRAMRSAGFENIYYCDTDSIFTEKELPSDMIHESICGKWKRENTHPITRAVFSAPKTYCYEENKILVKKAKGIYKDDMCYDDYVKLVNGETVSKTITMFKRTFDGVYISPVIRSLTTKQEESKRE
jgi:DNA polymerase type B, organellar and viral